MAPLTTFGILLALLAAHSLAYRINDREVKLQTGKANWFKASEACRRHGMQLITVRTVKDSADILSMGRDYGMDSLWTAATDLGNGGSWVWSTSGQQVSPTFWMEPQDEEANCVEAVMEGVPTANWRAVDCMEKRAYLCEQIEDDESERVQGLSLFQLLAQSGVFLKQMGITAEQIDVLHNSTVVATLG